MSLIPNTSPKLFSLSAVVVGYLLIDDMSANEQNALGNWLMLVGQLISTNAYYAAVASERNNNSNNSNMSNQADRNQNSNSRINNSNFNNQDTLKMLEKMLKALNEEVNNIKKDLNK